MCFFKMARLWRKDIQKTTIMEKSISYRTLSLLLGITVAAIIMLLLWISQPGQDATSELNPLFSLPVDAKFLVKKMAMALILF